MADFEPTNENQAIIPATRANGEETATTQDWRAQAQSYGQQAGEVLNKAKGYAQEYIGQAGDKFKDLQNKDFGQITEEAKDYTRRKPGQAILISAAAGLIIGFLLKGRR
jgi:ElaB/YqjD/DUF883 family membrane-anchored ribosome-binding protein